MTHTHRISAPRLLLALAFLAVQNLPTCLGQQSTPQDRRRLETIEKRLERIEQTLNRIENKADSGGVQERGAAAPSRPARGAQFQIPSDLKVRAIRTDEPVTESAPTAGAEPDRDRDDLTDAEEALVGTDPDNRDTDGDALWDGWEVHTIDGLDLHSLGASPLHKDIFVEMDFMKRASASNGLAPSDAVLRGIEAVFAAAPVPNPDFQSGINIHLVRGNEVPYDDDLNPYFTEFAKLRNAHFDPKRARAFHYMIWANGYTYNGSKTSSGISMDIPHSEFIVTLGTWNNGQGGTDLEKIGTFIHELGHNLGRMHGGSDHNNYKPNHLSVMNYHFQTRGILRNGARAFDYQRFVLPTLDEGSLQEQNGLGGSPNLAGYSTIFRILGPDNRVRLREVACDGPMDWNLDGMFDPLRISVDLDQDTQFREMLGTPDEWSALVYNGGVIGERVPLGGILERSSDLYDRLPVAELTEEADKLIESSLQGAPQP